MLYQLYETQRALMAPFADFASATARLYSHPLSPFKMMPGSGRLSAGFDLILCRGCRFVQVHHRDAVDDREDAAVARQNAVDELDAVLDPVERCRHQLEPSAAVRTPEHLERVQSHAGIIEGGSRISGFEDLRI